MKKVILLLITTFMLCAVLTACSNSTDEISSTPVPVNPGHVDSLPEDSVIVDINALCSGAGEPNAAGWIPANIYIDTIQTQYDQTQDENLKLILTHAENPISSAYLFLGTKFSENTVTYAYESNEVGTDNIIIVYVEIASSGSTNITTGSIEDKDTIILGITNTEDSTENTEVNDETTNTDVLYETKTDTDKKDIE